MGTRSLTLVFQGTDPIVNMYRQYDGYPSCHGKELAEFLRSKKLVNGLSLDGNKDVANGMYCLAAQLVAKFKDGPGEIYLFPTDDLDSGQDYEYRIYGDHKLSPLRVVVTDPNEVVFDGGLDEFAEFCEKDK